MNFIAALLLSYMDNELAFYTQVCLNRDFFNGYFTDELVPYTRTLIMYLVRNARG